MSLKVLDYPLDQYAGHFEFFNALDFYDAAYRAQFDEAMSGNPDAMERAAALKRKLDSINAGDMAARVYTNGGEAQEFVGSKSEAEAFVVEQMAALKVEN